MNTLIIAIFLFWLLIFFHKVGYYLYLWQIKDYRIARMVSELREPGGYAILLNRNFVIKLIALGLTPWLLPQYFMGVLGALYFLEFAFITYHALRGASKFPVVTVKSLLILVLSFALPVERFVSLSFGSLEDQGMYLLLVDMITPVIVTFWVLFFKPFTHAAKQLIVKRAIRKRNHLKHITRIGITGSFGKTTTKEFLATMLAGRFAVAKTRQHENTEIGVAHAILDMDKNTEVLVAEMAAYHKGDIAEIAHVLKPTIGILTAIGPQHVSLFGDLAAIIETKFELAAALPKEGTLIANWDNEYIRKKLEHSSYNVRLMRYSVQDSYADVYASHIKERMGVLEFRVHHKKKWKDFAVGLFGRHNISNILAAVAAGLTVGMTLKELALAAKEIEMIPHTLHVHHGVGDFTIMDDSYNASFDGTKAALATLDLFKGKRKIVVMPSLIELGNEAPVLHEELGVLLAKHADEVFLTDGKFFPELAKGWEGAGKDIHHLHAHSDAATTIRELTVTLNAKSVVLLEGRSPKAIMNFILHHRVS